MNINEIAKAIHKNAVEHGWWDEDRSVAEIIALCHSELSEALEAYRNREPLVWDNDGKPDGIAVEMIDCVIRVFDYLSHIGVDIEKIMTEKHEFNKSRPYKHGGKKIEGGISVVLFIIGFAIGSVAGVVLMACLKVNGDE